MGQPSNAFGSLGSSSAMGKFPGLEGAKRLTGALVPMKPKPHENMKLVNAIEKKGRAPNVVQRV